MNKNWMRRINPFYFEPKFLIYGVWMNVVIVCFLLSPISLVPRARSISQRFAEESVQVDAHVSSITDVTTLQHMLHDQLVFNQVEADHAREMAWWLGYIAASLIFVFCINISYLWRAHRALKQAAIKQ